MKEYLEGEKDGVIKISASWCEPCRNFAPVFAMAEANNPGLFFANADIDNLSHDMKLWLKSELGIKTIPAVVFYKNEKPVRVVKGSETTVSELQQVIDEVFT